MINKGCLILVLILLAGADSLAQEDSLDVADPALGDSLEILTSPPAGSFTADSSMADSIAARASRSGMDSVVVYSANDSIVFRIKDRTMRLRGDSKLDYKDQKLAAEVIELDFSESTIAANGVKDSSGIITGFPQFNDSGEEFVGERLKFNFKTNKGTISLGETQLSEGFYFGTKIKRISQSEFFVKDGYYTTCDAPSPHYYFGSPEMKVIAKDRVFLDPIIFYVEDLPMFAIPFGLFFPSKSGRQSGIIIPSFFFSENRGIVFNDLGFYFALSDYYDTKFTADIYTKGGYLLKNHTRWSLRNRFNGSANLQYGNTRYNPDDEWTQAYSIQINHQHTIDPQTRLTANLDFKSQDFNQNTQTNQRLRQQQEIRSNASLSRSFDNGSNVSFSYDRSQNINTGTYSETAPQLSYSLPNWNPLKPLVSSGNSFSWLRDVSFSYSGSARRTVTKSEKTEIVDDSTVTREDIDTRQLISHSPSISISPKLGYFTVRPQISFRANNYFRKVTKAFNPADSSISESEEKGFFTEYTYSLGVSASTRLFGVADDSKPIFFFVKPSWMGLKAMRHTWQPTVGFSYTPDQSDPGLGLYGSYYDESTQREVVYSRFEKDGGGIASRRLSQSINYSDLHSFEIKMSQGDTLPDKNLELLRLTFNTGYNLAADSLGFNDINMTFRSPALGFISFSGNARFTVYDDIKNRDSETGEIIPNSYSRVNQFLLKNGKGLARMTSFGLELSTSFSSQGVSFGDTFGQDMEQTADDTVALGRRFSKRHAHEQKFDLFGDSSPGYSPVNVPWNISLGLSFSYGRQFSFSDINRRLNLRTTVGFKLTPTWSIDASGQYDFINDELLSPSVEIYKDMHCWELRLTWYPTGFSRGFYLRFGIKSTQLRDLKIEKRSSPLY